MRKTSFGNRWIAPVALSLLMAAPPSLLGQEEKGETEGESAALPSYSEVVASYPSGAELCQTEANVIGQTDSSWQFGSDSRITIRRNRLTYRCLGTKVTLDIEATWDDGKEYPAGTLLTVDADLNWVRVSGWD